MNEVFSRTGYRDVLSRLSELGYVFITMAGAPKAPTDRRTAILRHDVDLSLECALEMARLEAEIGVRSSYFILPHNDFYNPFSPGGRRMVSAIVGLGHEVGLHWDSSLYPKESQRLRVAFQADLERLAEIAGRTVVSASQHVPIDTPLADVSDMVEVEAYSSRLAARYVYVSDSAMRWRQHTPLSLAATGKDMHFLAHPIWWMAEGSDHRAKLDWLRTQTAARASGLIKGFQDYMERCLADREQMDAAYDVGRGQLLLRQKQQEA